MLDLFKKILIRYNPAASVFLESINVSRNKPIHIKIIVQVALFLVNFKRQNLRKQETSSILYGHRIIKYLAPVCNNDTGIKTRHSRLITYQELL